MRPKEAAFISVALLFLSWPSKGQTAPSEDGAALSGVVRDISRAVVAGANVTLSKVDGSQQRSSKTGADGAFAFTGLPADTYVVNVRAPGLQIFTSERLVLAPHQAYEMPNIVMGIAIANTEVTVRPTEQVAAEQVRAEERQRILGLIPNYFTSFIPDPVPLTVKQKFSLTSHDAFDPVSLAGVGIAAGIQQASNTFAGYGQGAAGYGKRYGAALGNSLSDNFLSHAVFPSLLAPGPALLLPGFWLQEIPAPPRNQFRCFDAQRQWTRNTELLLSTRRSGLGSFVQSVLSPRRSRSGVGVYERGDQYRWACCWEHLSGVLFEASHEESSDRCQAIKTMGQHGLQTLSQ